MKFQGKYNFPLSTEKFVSKKINQWIQSKMDIIWSLGTEKIANICQLLGLW